MSEKQGCSARVWRGRHNSPCSRKGVVERGGKLYCKQHDPIAIAEKNRIKTEKYNKKWDERKKNQELNKLREKKRDIAELLHDNLQILRAKGLVSTEIKQLMDDCETNTIKEERR